MSFRNQRPTAIATDTKEALMSALDLPTLTFTGSSKRHRHAEKSDAALQLLLTLFADQPERPHTHWRTVGTRNGTRISVHGTLNGSAGMLPVVRGDGVIDGGFAPREVIAVINSLGARKQWDPRFDGGKLVQIFNPTEWLAHIALKGTFPLANRDVVVATQFYRDERNGFLCYCSTSVEDALVPLDPQRVRGRLTVAGWIIRPDPTCDDGSRLLVTYIVQMDVCGQLPHSVAKMLQRELPTCISSVARYLRRYTFPPHLVPQLSPPRRHTLAKPLPPKSPRRPSRRPGGGVRVIHDTFEHRLATYDLAYRVELNPLAYINDSGSSGGSSTCGSPLLSPRSSISSSSSSQDVVAVEVRIPQPLFPNGVDVEVRPAERIAWQLIDERTGRVVSEGGNASEAVIATACERLAQIALVIDKEEEEEKGQAMNTDDAAAKLHQPAPARLSIESRDESELDSIAEQDGYFDTLPTPVVPGRVAAVPTVSTCAFGRVVRRRRVSSASEDSNDSGQFSSSSSEDMPHRIGAFSALPSGLQSPLPQSPTLPPTPMSLTRPPSLYDLPIFSSQRHRHSTSNVSLMSSALITPPDFSPTIGVVGQIGARGLSRSNSTCSTGSTCTSISPLPVADLQHAYATRHPGHRLIIYNDARIDGRTVQVCIKKRPPPKQRLFGAASTWQWIHRD